MQNLSKQLDILKELRDEYGITAIKAEFEAEGSRLDELIMLNEVVARANLKLFIKIGGCEAVRDLDQCKLLGASGIMAPMIETPFAMSKFVGAAKKVYGDRCSDIDWIINTETKTCLQNIDDILSVGKGFLQTISIGRVDLSASMGLSRAQIEGKEVYDVACVFANKAKEYGVRVGVGGGVSFDTVPFLVASEGMIQRFETRKVVFPLQGDAEHLKHGILKAMDFEISYLENKCAFYDDMAREDLNRMEMLRERRAKAEAQLKG